MAKAGTGFRSRPWSCRRFAAAGTCLDRRLDQRRRKRLWHAFPHHRLHSACCRLHILSGRTFGNSGACTCPPRGKILLAQGIKLEHKSSDFIRLSSCGHADDSGGDRLDRRLGAARDHIAASTVGRRSPSPAGLWSWRGSACPRLFQRAPDAACAVRRAWRYSAGAVAARVPVGAVRS